MAVTASGAVEGLEGAVHGGVGPVERAAGAVGALAAEHQPPAPQPFLIALAATGVVVVAVVMAGVAVKAGLAVRVAVAARVAVCHRAASMGS